MEPGIVPRHDARRLNGTRWPRRAVPCYGPARYGLLMDGSWSAARACPRRLCANSSPPPVAPSLALWRGPSLSKALVREFIRPAVRAIPCSMARRLGPCRISLPAEVASGVASRWTMTDGGLEVTVSTAGLEEHDVAMELLLCLGQGLWERLSDGELRAYWMLLNDEIIAGIEGEIDEQALR